MLSRGPAIVDAMMHVLEVLGSVGEVPLRDGSSRWPGTTLAVASSQVVNAYYRLCRDMLLGLQALSTQPTLSVRWRSPCLQHRPCTQTRSCTPSARCSFAFSWAFVRTATDFVRTVEQYSHKNVQCTCCTRCWFAFTRTLLRLY